MYCSSPPPSVRVVGSSWEGMFLVPVWLDAPSIRGDHVTCSSGAKRISYSDGRAGYLGSQSKILMERRHFEHSLQVPDRASGYLKPEISMCFRVSHGDRYQSIAYYLYWG